MASVLVDPASPMTAEPDELTAYGDADLSSEDLASLSSLHRKTSLKRPKPQKRRSQPRLRASVSDSEGIYPERTSRVHFSESPEPTAGGSGLQRSLSVGHHSSELRRLTEQLDASQEKLESLERNLKKVEAAHHSALEESGNWKRRYNETKRNLDAVRVAQEQQEAKTHQLQEEVDKLQQKLNAKEREKATLNRHFDNGLNMVQQSEAQYKAQIASLTQSNEKLKAELGELKEHRILDSRTRNQHETEAQAHVIMIKTLEAEVEKWKKHTQEVEEALAFERRRRRADSIGPAGCAEHSLMIDELQETNRSLGDQNQSLQEEVENLRSMLEEAQHAAASAAAAPATPVPILASPPVSVPTSPTTGKPRPRIPPRSSSAQDLLAMYEAGAAGGGSLATELLKTQVQAGVKTELQRLRQENVALVNYLAATLESVSKLR
ncbi:hypothetical protein HK104_001933 [Borealophlyctis nickersoniae]|nr:hypothetical protein HK104_001933 [Borealophlyctis nickersoniae]